MKKFLIYLITILGMTISTVLTLRSQVTNVASSHQGIDAQLIIGMNFSQLSGDDYDGYRMLGIRLGTEMGFRFRTRVGMTVGLLYDEKGSSSTFSLTSGEETQKIKLRYLSVPIDFTIYSDYRSATQRYRLRYNMGISFGRLFSVRSNRLEINDIKASFTKYDIAPNIGLTYNLSRKSSINIRAEWSLPSLHNGALTPEATKLRSYLISTQYIYSLSH